MKSFWKQKLNRFNEDFILEELLIAGETETDIEEVFEICTDTGAFIYQKDFFLNNRKNFHIHQQLKDITCVISIRIIEDLKNDIRPTDYVIVSNIEFRIKKRIGVKNLDVVGYLQNKNLIYVLRSILDVMTQDISLNLINEGYSLDIIRADTLKFDYVSQLNNGDFMLYLDSLDYLIRSGQLEEIVSILEEEIKEEERKYQEEKSRYQQELSEKANLVLNEMRMQFLEKKINEALDEKDEEKFLYFSSLLKEEIKG